MKNVTMQADFHFLEPAALFCIVAIGAADQPAQSIFVFISRTRFPVALKVLPAEHFICFGLHCESIEFDECHGFTAEGLFIDTKSNQNRCHTYEIKLTMDPGFQSHIREGIAVL